MLKTPYEQCSNTIDSSRNFKNSRNLIYPHYSMKTENNKIPSIISFKDSIKNHKVITFPRRNRINMTLNNMDNNYINKDYRNKIYSNTKERRMFFIKGLISNKNLLSNKNKKDYSNYIDKSKSSHSLTERKYNNLCQKKKSNINIKLNFSSKIDSLSNNNYFNYCRFSENNSYRKEKNLVTYEKIPEKETSMIIVNNIYDTIPSKIRISIKDNNLYSLDCTINSFQMKKNDNRIRDTFKERNNSYVNKNINNINNNLNKKKSAVTCSLKNFNLNRIINDKILKIKHDECFSKYMLTHINQIRINPKFFIKIIQKETKNIVKDKKGNILYNNNLKIALHKGKEAFEDAISSLNKTKPMKPLLFKKDLCINISSNEKEFRSGEYLRNQIKNKINKGIKIKAFWRDIISDPEINFLLMIVDDNPVNLGAKRKDILNPKMKYIGINSARLDSHFVCYIVLSDE